jgi:hypothetical protein
MFSAPVSGASQPDLYVRYQQHVQHQPQEQKAAKGNENMAAAIGDGGSECKKMWM